MPTRCTAVLVRLGSVLFLSAALWAALISFAYAAESIQSFTAVIEVAENGDLLITENIVYDFGANQRHGIYRNVTNRHPQASPHWYQTRYVEPVFESVTRDGRNEQSQLDAAYSGMSVRIGDPNRTITGVHEYEIRYRVAGAIGTYDDRTELYWNLTGDEWEVPMAEISIALRAADGVLLLPAVACYSEQECAIEEPNKQLTFFSARNLAPGQQVTIAQEINLPQEPEVLLRYNLWLIIPIMFGFTVLTLIFLTYRWKTKYKFKQAIIAQYEPYEDFKPMFTGVLIDNRLDSRDITAGLVYLAQQGFIKIKQTTKKVLFGIEIHDYEVTLLRPYHEADSHFQRDILSLIFAGQTSAKEIDAQPTFLGIKLGSSGKDAGSLEVGKMVRLSDIKKNQTKLRANFKMIQALKKSVKDDLLSNDFIESIWKKKSQPGEKAKSTFTLTKLLLIFGAVIFTMLVMPFLIVLLFIALPFALFFERRTRKGYEALYHLKGFKDFLSTTEKDRYTFHNAPAKNPEQFMEYLPYAIAFGVEEEWAEVFKDIQIDMPDWYQSDVAGAHFSASDFSSEIGAFSSSLASSGSSAGSSGGGSAGGGGGGGGGGSW